MTKKTGRKSNVASEIAGLKSLSQSAAAQLLGMSRSTLRESGCPRNDDGSYDAVLAVQWAIDRAATTAMDPMLVDGDSPALERYREARAKLAELDYYERTQHLIPFDAALGILSKIADLIGGWVERSASKYGPELHDSLAAVIDECMTTLERELPKPEGEQIDGK